MNTTVTFDAPTISSSSMLVELSISVWTARKTDKAATEDILHLNHATKSAGNFNKNLLADCEELTAIQKFSANARNLHYASTLPWSDSGLRLLPTARYFDYHAQMTKMQNEFRKLVDTFITAYDWEVAQVHAKLGNLFNRDEYPTSDRVRSKFDFRLNYIPVPDASDWRVQMENEAQEALRMQYETFYTEQMKRSMQDVWDRLYKELARFINQLGVDEAGRKGKVFDGTIDNLRNLTELLGHVNFTNDPDLARAQQALAANLAGLCREDIVKNDAFRADLKKDMEAVIAGLPGLGW